MSINYIDDMRQAVTPEIISWLRRTGSPWMSLVDTWSYVSTTSIQVAGDMTGVYVTGTKYRLKQGSGYLYGYFVSPTYSAVTGYTTITLAGDAITNAAITDNEISYATPPDFPVWFSWSPSYTGFTTNPSDVSAKFCLHGSAVYWKFYAATAGTKDGTAGTVTVSLPVTAKNVTNGTWAEITRARNAGTWGTGLWVISPGGTVITFYATAAGGNFTASGSTNMSSMGFYEAA